MTATTPSRTSAQTHSLNIDLSASWPDGVTLAAGEVYSRLLAISYLAERVGEKLEADHEACNAAWAAIYLLRDTTKMACEVAEFVDRQAMGLDRGQS